MNCHGAEAHQNQPGGSDLKARSIGRRGFWSRGRIIAVVAALAVAAGVVAVLAFGMPPWTVAFGGLMALHPLIHLAGGHRHGSAHSEPSGRSKDPANAGQQVEGGDHMGFFSKRARDPVCGMDVDPKKAAAAYEYEGKSYYFCSPSCQATFVKEPAKYAKGTQQSMGGMHMGHH